MAIEFLLVSFPEQRAVLADGAGVGFTNHILMLPGDEYGISLDGGGYLPASRDIALAGTSMVRPMVISFDQVTAPAARSAAPTQMASDLPQAKPPVARKTRPPAKPAATARKKTNHRPAAKAAQPAVANSVARVKKDA